MMQLCEKKLLHPIACQDLGLAPENVVAHAEHKLVDADTHRHPCKGVVCLPVDRGLRGAEGNLWRDRSSHMSPRRTFDQVSSYRLSEVMEE